jgi:hypothetical protein
MDPELIERLRQLDIEGLMALRDAVREYHAKYSKGPGGAAICVCGASCGGSKACRGYSILRDLFRYANAKDPNWRERFAFVTENFL